jgi:hypothetical protein
MLLVVAMNRYGGEMRVSVDDSKEASKWILGYRKDGDDLVVVTRQREDLESGREDHGDEGRV